MKHQQILAGLAAAGHVKALDEDVARWVAWQMPDLRDVVPPILARWGCLLGAADAAPSTVDKVWVALATILHRYGLRDDTVTAHALDALDRLDRDVVLSDAFARRSAEVKALLTSPPVPLTRRPGKSRPVTFLRPGDVVSIQLDGRFHAAFVRELNGANDYPIIEFYAGVFDSPPAVEQLAVRPAARPRGRARFAVVGLTYLPDPAGQVRSVATGHPEPPVGGDPGVHDGLYTMSDLMRLQRHIRELFDH